MTDFDSLQKFFSTFGHWIATGILTAWTFLRTNDRENADELKSLAKDVSELKSETRSDNETQNTRITTLESAMKSLPTAGEFSELRADAAASRAQLKGIADLLRRLEHQTDLIQQHLMNGSKK